MFCVPRLQLGDHLGDLQLVGGMMLPFSGHRRRGFARLANDLAGTLVEELEPVAQGEGTFISRNHSSHGVLGSDPLVVAGGLIGAGGDGHRQRRRRCRRVEDLQR